MSVATKLPNGAIPISKLLELKSGNLANRSKILAGVKLDIGEGRIMPTPENFELLDQFIGMSQKQNTPADALDTVRQHLHAVRLLGLYSAKPATPKQTRVCTESLETVIPVVVDGKMPDEEVKKLGDCDPRALVNVCFDMGSGRIAPREENFSILENAIGQANQEKKNPNFLEAAREQLFKMANGVRVETPRLFRSFEIGAMSEITRDLPEVARKAGQGIFGMGSGALGQLRRNEVDFGVGTDQVMIRLEDEIMKKTTRQDV